MWFDEINKNFKDPSLVLLGNKIDMPKEKWEVTQDEINSLIKQKNFVYYVTSAKTNHGKNESFTYLANITYEKLVIKANKEDEDKKK